MIRLNTQKENQLIWRENSKWIQIRLFRGEADSEPDIASIHRWKSKKAPEYGWIVHNVGHGTSATQEEAKQAVYDCLINRHQKDIDAINKIRGL